MVLERHEKESLRQKGVLEDQFKDLERGIAAKDFRELEDTVLRVFKGPLIEDRDDLDLFRFYDFNKSDYCKDLFRVKIEEANGGAGAEE